MSTARVWLVIAVFSWAASAAGDCLPSGRNTFVAGLDALNRGDLQGAASSFDELVKAQPECAEARNNLAVVLVEQGHLNAAAEQLRRALQLRPDYQRARLNLDRVEALLTAQQAPTPRPSAPAAAAAPPVPPALETAPVPSAPAPSIGPAASSIVALLEPPGATACVIDPARQQLCVYRRTPTGIASEACYPLTAVRVAAWPRWLVASDLTEQRIRLVDETGQKRLKVVPETNAAGSELVGLRAADFAALSAQVVAWRTGWAVQDGPAAAVTASEAADMRAAVEHWRQVWEQQRFDDYVSFYGPGFRPQVERDIATWRTRKRYLFEHSGPIAVQLNNLSIFLLDHGATAVVSLEQTYRSEIFASRAFKVLRWERRGDRWVISAENVLREGPQGTAGAEGAGR